MTRAATGVRVAETLVAVRAGSARTPLLHRWPGLARPAVVHRLLDRSREHLRVDCHRSLLLAEGAAAISEHLHDRDLQGQSLRAKANALGVSGNNQAALELYEQALAAFEVLGNEPEIARTLSASLQPLILLGHYDRALASAERARELFLAHQDDMRLARLELNIANLLHRQDRFDEALACYERAYERLLPLQDIAGLISALHNKAVTLITLNQFHQALAAYQAARRLAVEHQRPLAVAQADYNIAWLYYLRGDYRRAIGMLQATADASERNGDAYHSALSLLDLSEIYLELNLSEDAREMAEEAHTRFQQLGMGYERAKALANTAIAYGRAGNAVRALPLFAEARELMVREHNQVWPSLIDLYQAVVLFNEARFFEARRLCLEALEFFVASTLPTKAALCRLLLARINLRLGAAEAARRQCETVSQELVGLDTPILTFHTRFLLGQAEAELGDRMAAHASYQAARRALEALRGRVPGEELKIAFVKNKVEVYECLVELALESDLGPARTREEAFACIEQAKSQALLDLIFQPVHAVAQVGRAEGELAHSIRERREELNWYYHLIESEQLRPSETSRPRIADLQRQVKVRERVFTRTLRKLARSDAQQSALYAPRAFSIDAIREALPADAVLLEYFQTHERIVLCLLDRTRLDITPVSLVSRVSPHVRLLQFQLSKFRLGPEYLDTFREPMLQATQSHLRHLFNELLAPVWPRLRGRHLLVVPHGLLHYVPFHALFDGDQYVLDASSVSYAPSASIYTLCHRQPSASTPGTALVLGIPDDRAPYMEAEARGVARQLPRSCLFLGAEATARVLQTLGSHSHIVHIASHGYFRPESPMFSGIRLGDGYLNVYDFYHLKLAADLVTLSGCATGASTAVAGDELLGVTRGLFSAGARTLLLSLWDVHDQTTAAFMNLLYSKISAGVPTIRALRSTMGEVRREYAHPYYWAPFVLMGKFWHS